MSGPCTHRWRIEEPNGPTARGVCRHCGEHRRFPTADAADRWAPENDADRQRKRAGIRAADGGVTW